jgi:L-ascorbate metabolism protein UlaG (beta-lactamase superfamily)
VAFGVELDGIHTIHLGEIGHLLTEERLADIGTVDVACVPVGGSLSATKTAELVAQLDPRIVVPMAIAEDEAAGAEALERFLHEMSAEPVVQARLSVTPSGLPAETTTILLELRGRT